MNLNQINGFDIFLIFIMLGSILFGLNKGFFATILGLIFWVASIFFTQKAYVIIEPILLEKFGSKVLSMLIGYGGILLVLMVVLGLLKFIILSGAKSIRKSFLDKILGMAFGLVRGALISILIFLSCNIIWSGFYGSDFDDHSAMPENILSSYSYPYLSEASKILLRTLPDEAKAKVKTNKVFSTFNIEKLQAIKDSLSENIDDVTIDKISEEIAKKREEGSSEREIIISAIKILIEYHKNAGNTDILNKEDIKGFIEKAEKEAGCSKNKKDELLTRKAANS